MCLPHVISGGPKDPRRLSSPKSELQLGKLDKRGLAAVASGSGGQDLCSGCQLGFVVHLHTVSGILYSPPCFSGRAELLSWKLGVSAKEELQRVRFRHETASLSLHSVG